MSPNYYNQVSELARIFVHENWPEMSKMSRGQQVEILFHWLRSIFINVVWCIPLHDFCEKFFSSEEYLEYVPSQDPLTECA
ncbi:MAG: hypothetical protein KKC05_01330 [Nanoarchaeota archaeon]|nr:hypothetical protein [Nanoarchaeota archaeon]